VQKKENRDKLKDWFYSDAEKAVDFYRKNFRLLYIDTVKHEDSLLQELLDSPEWYGIRLSICDDDYKSLDPNYMTDEEILAEVNEARRLGKLDIFYMERMNIPVAKEDASFKQEYFHTHVESEMNLKPWLENVVIIDPAKTVKMQSADSAIVGLSINAKESKIHVRDIVSRKMYPEEIYKEGFEMVDRLNARVLGVEVTGLEEFIKQPITNEAMMRGCRAELVWLKARGGTNDEKGKVERIKGLIPYYRQGYVTHNSSCCGKLEQQLLSFPKSKLWDVMDAVAYIVELMELGGRYFEGPENKDSQDPSEDDYEGITDEPEIKNWRVA
jgi:phage terminase large subunit-like protein